MKRVLMIGASDVIDNYAFHAPLKIGGRLIFEDMMYYTVVKMGMLNGLRHPDIGTWHTDKSFELVRHFTCGYFRDRLL